MRATSQASLDAAMSTWETTLAATGSKAAQLGEELFAVVDVLDGSAALRRALTEPNRDGSSKANLVAGVFEGKVSEETLDLLSGLARSRWSAEGDFAEACEQLGVTALLVSAEAREELASLEEDVFRMIRVLADNRDLRLALAEKDRSRDDRIRLLKSVFSEHVGGEALTLAARTISSGRSKSITAGLNHVSELAAERRERLLAVVTAAVPLSTAQQERLTDMLSRSYGRTIQVNITVDPAVVGGLRIQVGNEVVDGTILSRLEEARRRVAG